MQLYLNTYGVYLHIKDALFEVRLPQPGGGYDIKHFAAHKVTSIILTTSAALSTDAIRLALMNNVDIIFADSSGFPLGRIWHSKLGSTTAIRKAQLEASLGPVGVGRVVDWLVAKLEQHAGFLKDLKKHRNTLHPLLDERIAQIANLGESIRLLRDAPKVDQIADTLRGLEGTAGRLYFDALSAAMPSEYRLQGRIFRPAADSFTAFLNYGYGILYARVEKALMLAGLDPYVGFLHRDDYNQKSMVFDFIEPYRGYADRVVFRLFSGKLINQSHTRVLANGLALDTPGKQLLIEKFNHYLEVETIRYQGRNQTRANAMQQDAHRFANELIGK